MCSSITLIRKLDDSEFRNPFSRAYIKVKSYEGSPSRSRSRSRNRSRSRSVRRNRRYHAVNGNKSLDQYVSGSASRSLSASRSRSASPARMPRSIFFFLR